MRPEIVKQLDCPSIGLATSCTISRRNVPFDSLEAARTLFEREYWPFPKEKIRKSDSRAASFGMQGNAEYKKTPNDPTKALRLYNQSICAAEKGSKELGLGYANRSAVYLNRKMYRECLQNIELARSNNYPPDMMPKLLQRKERCKQLMEADGESSTEHSTSSHCAIKSCLELGKDGKGICTNRSLDEGEKIILEKPFVLVLEAELAYERCDYCGACNEHNLMPCTGCTAVMYCSEECQEQALQRYHQFECEIVDDLQLLFRGQKQTRTFHVILRLFWHAVLLFLEDPDGFLKRIDTPTELQKYQDPFTLEPSDYILHLNATCPEIPMNDESARTGKCVSQIMTILMWLIAVEENASLWSRLEGKVGKKKLMDLLYRLIMRSSQLTDYKMDNATCFYPFTRMLQRSDTPNAEQLMTQDFQSVIVLKCPVSEGQKITIPKVKKIPSYS
ncbi:SET and MYND domain-containing protein 4-like [Anopheles moucheti]|uniref:SET and MYND domain-containing protein 4-like n=1 Tax=Anopheles moucheti TaxID=186751 RepID=UPI0022F0E56F|nr:SET and MYND domain-containing protein 4-like [Anopheles moucheti]